MPRLKSTTLVCLSGEMGAGKTETVKMVCEELGLTQAQSPTFGLAHFYQNSEKKLSLYHVDLYRIQSEEDLDSTGFWDLFNETKTVVFVEWSNLITEQSWPWNWNRIDIHIENKDSNRQIKLRFQQA